MHLPDVGELENHLTSIDPPALYAARRSVMLDLLSAFKAEMKSMYQDLMRTSDGTFDPTSVGKRRLQHELLGFLCSTRDRDAALLAYAHYNQATCMADKFNALRCLANMHHAERDQAFDQFYKEAKGAAQLEAKVIRFFRQRTNCSSCCAAAVADAVLVAAHAVFGCCSRELAAAGPLVPAAVRSRPP